MEIRKILGKMASEVLKEEIIDGSKQGIANYLELSMHYFCVLFLAENQTSQTNKALS